MIRVACWTHAGVQVLSREDVDPVVRDAHDSPSACVRILERLLCRGGQDDVLGALDDEERATLHALLLRAAGGQLPSGGCAEAASDTC